MALVKQPNVEPIPGYRLIEPLGRGGFGEVWRCEAPGGLQKAIKFIFGSLNTLDESFRAEQELSALERVKAVRHPFILSIERIEVVHGELIIVMELADKSLHDLLIERQAEGFPGLDRSELLDYLADAAEALDLMNEQHNLQHLDIKPRNLFVVSNHVKVADFGLVKDLEGLSSTNLASGGLTGAVTPLYASPETFQGIISKRSDQYSLAIVYQELVSGTLPFNGKNPRQLALQHTRQDPDLRPLAEQDRPIVSKALSKEPQHRFESCVDFIKALTMGKITPAPVRRSGSTQPVRRAFSVHESLHDLALSPNTPLPDRSPVGEDNDLSPRPLSPDEIARLSLTVVQPLTGSLKPTLVLGLGRLGRQAVQALRCRFIDRFGSLAKLPLLRFLCLDTDQEELQKALYGPPEQALTPNEVYPLPLQTIMHYRRNRQALDQLTAWLPLEKLYAVPRSLATNGVRAVGRLAFHENFLRLAARLKRELQVATEPAALDNAVKQTGLPLRSDVPQVYVFTAGSGGTGSGMLVDLGYTCRRVLQELGHGAPEVVAFIMCGAPDDPATPPEEQANLYATLTEINHFSDRRVEWSAQFGIGGPTYQDKAAPFQAAYLIKLGARGQAGVTEMTSRLACYAFHDLSSPLGHRIAQSRQRQAGNRETPFRSFGTYTVWYPRGLLLRVAGRFACQRLLESWQTANTNAGWLQNVTEFADRLVLDAHWRPDVLRQRVEETATHLAGQEGSPAQAISSFLRRLEEQAATSLVAQQDPAEWCRKALEDAYGLTASGVAAAEGTSELAKCWLNRTFDEAARKIADQYLQTFLAAPVHQMFDQPGYRLAAAESVFAHLLRRCDERLAEQLPALEEERQQTQVRWQGLEQAFHDCMNPGTFVLFAAKRMQRLLRGFVDRLGGYARQRVQQETARSVTNFYAALRGRIQDLQRDLQFCRQRLRALQEGLINVAAADHADLPSTALAPAADGTGAHQSSSQILRDAALAMAQRIVLPDGIKELEEAANRFLGQVWHEQWYNLDQYLQRNVIQALGGLHTLCMRSSDLTRKLGAPMLETAAEYLGQLLQVTDVCEVELSAAQAQNTDLAAQIKYYHHISTPSVGAKKADRERSYVLVPASDGGRRLGDLARKAVPALQVVPFGCPTDLLLCREQGDLNLLDVEQVVGACKAAYLDRHGAPPSTPHARADIIDWNPLEP